MIIVAMLLLQGVRSTWHLGLTTMNNYFIIAMVGRRASGALQNWVPLVAAAGSMIIVAMLLLQGVCPGVNRRAVSQASAIMTAPVVVMVNDTVWIRDGPSIQEQQGCGPVRRATSAACPGVNRRAVSQASAIMTAPVVVMVNDTVWIRDGVSSSPSPSCLRPPCTRGLTNRARANTSTPRAGQWLPG